MLFYFFLKDVKHRHTAPHSRHYYLRSELFLASFEISIICWLAIKPKKIQRANAMVELIVKIQCSSYQVHMCLWHFGWTLDIFYFLAPNISVGKLLSISVMLHVSCSECQCSSTNFIHKNPFFRSSRWKWCRAKKNNFAIKITM